MDVPNQLVVPGAALRPATAPLRSDKRKATEQVVWQACSVALVRRAFSRPLGRGLPGWVNEAAGRNEGYGVSALGRDHP